MKCISDFNEGKLPVREFFIILGTLYPVELSELIKILFKARKGEHNIDRNNMIEVTEEAKRK